MYQRAEALEDSGKADEAIKYRMRAAQNWSKIVKQQINVASCTIEDIENGKF